MSEARCETAYRAAITSAVADATDARVYDLPLTAEKVYAGLHES